MEDDMNWLQTSIQQGNFNISDHDASSVALANSGQNAVLGGLLAVNAANPATATSAAVNVAPISQSNVAVEVATLFDNDFIDFF
jgi:hypothetical protein